MSTKPKSVKISRTTNTQKRLNILTPPPSKGVVVSDSFLDAEDHDSDTENEEEVGSVESDSEVKEITEEKKNKKEERGEEEKENKKEERGNKKEKEELRKEQKSRDRRTREPEPKEEKPILQRKAPIKGNIVTAENVLARYGYKAMEKLVNNKGEVLYIRCVNTNGHTVFCDMQDSDYINEVEGNNVIRIEQVSNGHLGGSTSDISEGLSRDSLIPRSSQGELSQEVKDASYGCVETYIDGVCILYDNYYITLTRNGHHFKPKETVYMRKTHNDFNSKSDQLIPFPIVSFVDICENSTITDRYIYTVIDKIYTQFYKEKESKVNELVNKIDKLNEAVMTSYENILEKIRKNIAAIDLLENYKAQYDEKEGNISSQHRANLKSVVINLRITNSIERENITALTTLASVSSKIDELMKEIETQKEAYEKNIESLDKKMER